MHPRLLVPYLAGLVILPVAHAASQSAGTAAASADLAPATIEAKALGQLQKVAGADWTKLSGEPAGQAFLGWLQANPDFARALMLSGPLPADPGKMLRVAAALHQADAKGLANRHERTTAAAVALTFGQPAWPEDRALARYGYFRDSRLAGLLHPGFDTLATWEKRFVVSAGSNGGYSGEGGWDDASLAWLRDHVKLPADAYLGACWQAPYRLENVFGDSIHGADYYAPFGRMIHAQRVRDVGGVCGSLSHYGATAARANGIPAITMGEPGHCAYAVRLARGQWTPAYSLSWQRGLHTSLWGSSWTQLVLQDLAMADEAAHDQCTIALWDARAASAADPAAAAACYRRALAAQPIHLPAWLETVAYFKERDVLDATGWLALRDQAIDALAAYPESAWDAMKGMVAPAMAKLPANERLGFLLPYHLGVADQAGPVPWNFAGALAEQANALGSDSAVQMVFFEHVLAIQASSSSWFAPTIAWGQEKFGKSPDSSAAYFAVLAKVFASDAAGGNKDGLRAALRPAVLAAAAAGNVEAFQALGKAGAALRGPANLKVEPFAGELLSSGGLLKISSTSGWDSPEDHWGVLEACGGRFHTAAEVRPNAVVRLGKLGELSGIVIVNQGGGQNGPRQLPMKVSVSEDGTQWTQVFRADANAEQWRIPLDGKATRVQFIKVERDDERNEVFHLGAILAYGRRLQ